MKERVLFYYDGWMIRVFCSGLPLILRLLELAKRKERWLLHKIHHMRHESAIKREDLKSWMGTRRVTLLRGHGVGWPGRSGIFIINLIVNVLRNNTNWGGARVWNYTREGESGRVEEIKNLLICISIVAKTNWRSVLDYYDCDDSESWINVTVQNIRICTHSPMKGEFFFYRREQ